MNMRKVLGLVLLVLIVFSLSSCEELLGALLGGVSTEPTTMSARITAFQDELNTDDDGFDSMYLHYHTEAVGYDNLISASVWDAAFNSTYVYTFSDIQTDDTAYTATATLSYVDQYGTDVLSGSVSFEFRVDDDGVVLIYSYVGIDGTLVLENMK